MTTSQTIAEMLSLAPDSSQGDQAVRALAAVGVAEQQLAQRVELDHVGQAVRAEEQAVAERAGRSWVLGRRSGSPSRACMTTLRWGWLRTARG